MPLDAPVMKTSGDGALIDPASPGERPAPAAPGGPRAAAGRSRSWRRWATRRNEGRARAALQVDDARQVVVFHPLGVNDALALGDDHGQVRAQALDVAKGMQEVAL